MTTYRVGNHHGVTIVREDDSRTCGRPDHDCTREHLVAVVTNDDWELAEDIADRLNWPTPDVPHTHGAREALAWVRRALDIAAKPDEQLFAATIHEMLRHAAAELGLDEEEKP